MLIGKRLIIGSIDSVAQNSGDTSSQKNGIAVETGLMAKIKRVLGLATKITINGEIHTINNASARKWLARTTHQSDFKVLKISRLNPSVHTKIDQAIKIFGKNMGLILASHAQAQSRAAPPSCTFSKVEEIIEFLRAEENIQES